MTIHRRQGQGLAAVNGTELYYEITGTGRPLVLMHGFALDTRMWDAQVDAFSRQYEVIRYDLRGFGKSALPTHVAYSHADDLRALLHHLDIERAFIAGLSRGGRWAIQFALDYNDFVSALIVADAMPTGFKTLEERPSLSTSVVSASTQGVSAARIAWFNHRLFETARHNAEVSDLLWNMILGYSGWHWYHEDPVVSSHPPAAQRLSEIAIPTLVIVGERDVDDFLAAADFMHKAISHSSKSIISNAGHMSNMENASNFNEAVLTFLDGNSCTW